MTDAVAPRVIVSGLPRSGTSLMMQMIHAAGVPVLSDGVRGADEDNPRGYYELEAVKRTGDDSSWLAESGGKAVKVISSLLLDLPLDRDYKVVFMRRSLDEILASQRKMLERRGEPSDAEDDDAMKRRFAHHVEEIETWGRSDRVAMLWVSYNRLVTDPASQARRVCDFLGADVEPDVMAAAVDPTLYRQRK